MSDEGGRWGRFFRRSRCFCFGCSSCSMKSFDDEHEPKMEESEEEILTRRPLEQLHSHQPQIHQPHKHQQQKTQFLPLLQRNLEGGDTQAFTGKAGKRSDSELSTPHFGTRDKYVMRCSVQKNVRRCSLEERVPSFVLPQSYMTCDLTDIHYLEQAQRLLSNVNKWNFNIFVLDWLTNGRSFYYLVMHLFHEYNFLEIFKLDIVYFLRTLRLVELGYCRRNPYHNSLHAADVVQAIHCNMKEDCIAPYLTPIEQMAAIMAAACHDLDHPGVNQSFLIASSHHLAPLYEGTSVLENHHWRGTVSILRESHLFDHLSHTQWNRLRYLLEVLILATDITKQQDILIKFREYVNTHSLDLANNEEHRNFILQITLKCADICNPCRSWKVSKKWSQLICEEFFRQGDKEKLMNLPVTLPFDRTQSTTAKIQTGFMSFVVEPLFLEWDKFAPSNRSRTMLMNLNTNRSKWTEISRDELLEENQNKSSTSTVVSFLDWEDDEYVDDDVNDDKNLLLASASSRKGKNFQDGNHRASDFSRKFGSRKSSSSSVGLKFKLKSVGLTAEKENFNPSIRSVRGSEILTSSKCSLTSSDTTPKSGENRRLSLPASKQAPQSSQALNHRRASLPLARILEIGSSNSSRGGWSLMINTSSGQLESLSELSPPVDESGETESSESKAANRPKLSKETELGGKKYERLKCKFSFDSGRQTSKPEMERSESFSSACYKKHKKYQQKIYHHYSEMVLSLCPNRWFESKKRRSSCPLADTKAFNNNNSASCPSSNHNCCSDADEGLYKKYQSNLGKRGLLMVVGEDCTSPEGGTTVIPLSELKLHNVKPHPVLPGRNRRFASLTEEIDWPKSRPSKKRAKSLVTSSLTEDGSVICQTHLLQELEDEGMDCGRKDDAASPGCSTAGRPPKRNVFIALQSSSKEIFSKLTSGGATPPRNSGLYGTPQRSSRLSSSPAKSSPAILRFMDCHLRPQKSASKRTSSAMDSDHQDGEVVPLLLKS